jgi:hypothetical protein
MKLNKKKLIAREFLILMLCGLVFGSAYLGTLPYNYFINSKIDNLENESQLLEDSVETLTKFFSDKIDKQKWFFNESEKLNITGIYNTYTELWERLEYLEKADSIQYKWDNVWNSAIIEIIQKIGFSKGHQFEQFIESNSLSTDEINQNNSVILLNNELDKNNSRIRTEKYKVLNSGRKMETALTCLMFFGVLSFPVRYLLYALGWSIKTLKQKDNHL